MNEKRNGTYAVEVDGLTRRFGAFVAVDNMSFKVKKGEIFGFLGPNGAGKSTTIRMLCGLLAPSSGKAFVGGYDVGANPDDVKATIGYMSQRFSLYDDLTVEENVNFYGGIYGLDNQLLKERKQWAIAMAGLTGKEKTLARTLSGGWKQRLALGCAILHEPPIVFLDEPTGGVDPVSRRDFWDLIYSLSNNGVTVFVMTHYLDEAEHCHTIGLIYNGKLIALGSPSSLKGSLEKYRIFQVACDRPVDAMELLQGQPWVVETSIFGSAFHVSTMKMENPGDRLREVLGAQGIVIGNLEQIVPSLEDVFIHLISEEGARASSPAATP